MINAITLIPQDPAALVQLTALLTKLSATSTTPKPDVRLLPLNPERETVNTVIQSAITADADFIVLSSTFDMDDLSEMIPLAKQLEIKILRMREFLSTPYLEEVLRTEVVTQTLVTA